MPYEIFLTNISNALQLVEVAKTVGDPNSKQLLYRSAIVLSVAHWQNYNEELMRQCAELIIQRATSSDNLPGTVKREIGKWIMRKEAVQSHPEKAAKLIWDYAGGIWKEHYGEFAREKIKGLNTPNSKNLVELYRGILGIDDISADWARLITAYPPSDALDRILNTRHEIAHGSFSGTLAEKQMIDDIEILKELAKVTNYVASYETVQILKNCGTTYNLDSYDLKGLIKWLADQPEPKAFRVTDMSKINNSWYANHNKLSYSAWDLLQGPRNQRVPTDRFRQFINGKISIPYEIVSFGGIDSIAKPGTQMVFYKDL